MKKLYIKFIVVTSFLASNSLFIKNNEVKINNSNGNVIKINNTITKNNNDNLNDANKTYKFTKDVVKNYGSNDDRHKKDYSAGTIVLGISAGIVVGLLFGAATAVVGIAFLKFCGSIGCIGTFVCSLVTAIIGFSATSAIIFTSTDI